MAPSSAATTQDLGLETAGRTSLSPHLPAGGGFCSALTRQLLLEQVALAGDSHGRHKEFSAGGAWGLDGLRPLGTGDTDEDPSGRGPRPPPAGSSAPGRAPPTWMAEWYLSSFSPNLTVLAGSLTLALQEGMGSEGPGETAPPGPPTSSKPRPTVPSPASSKAPSPFLASLSQPPLRIRLAAQPGALGEARALPSWAPCTAGRREDGGRCSANTG